MSKNNMLSEIMRNYIDAKESLGESEMPNDLETTMETSSEIKEQVMDMMSYILKRDITKKRIENMDEYKQECMVKFTNFHQRYPTLFFSIIENPSSFPIYRLDEMLELKKKIEQNKIDEEKASVQLGNKYYNEFVKDTVTELDKTIKK